MRAIITALVPMLVAFPLFAQPEPFRGRDTTQLQNRFTLEMNEGTFVVREISGLLQESDVREYQLVRDPIQRRSHRATFNRVRLTTPMTEANPFIAWRHQVAAGEMKGARREVRVIARASDGQAVTCYALHEAWPSSVEVPPIRGNAGPPGMLVVELTYQGFEIRAGPCARS